MTGRVSVAGSSEEGEPTATVEEESMDDPLSMGPPSRDPLLATRVPPELELRDPGSGVWTRQLVSRGTRLGTFIGLWVSEPEDPRYALEVSSLARATTGQVHVLLHISYTVRTHYCSIRR